MSASPLSITECQMRLGEIDTELTKLASYARPSNRQAERSTELAEEADELRARIAKLESIAQAHQVQKREGREIPGASFGTILKPSRDEIFNDAPSTDNTLRAIELALETRDQVSSDRADLRVDERALRGLFDRHPVKADAIRAAAHPDYLAAFGKLIAAGDPGAALLRMTHEERDAFTRVADAEARAAGLTDNVGGYAVPVLLDPSVIYTGDGNANPFRRISRIVTGMDDTWRGVSSAGITAEWDSEAQEAPDSTPTLAQPTVSAHKANAFVPFSVEIEGDWSSMAAEMGQLLQESKDDLESVAFSTGSGTDQPVGVLTALFAGSATAGVLPTTDGQFAAADIYKVFGELPPRYRRNASWLASIDVQNEIRQFGNDQLSNHTVPLNAGYEFSLLGRPVYEASGFPEFTGTTGAANICVVGDFRHFAIFDRVGMRVELVNHLFGSNRRPDGQRGLYAWWRVGSDVLVDNAFRMLLNA